MSRRERHLCNILICLVNKTPTPAIESMNDASIEIPNRNKYTVLVSCEISINKFITIHV